MSGMPEPLGPMTVDEYLAFDKDASVPHEYVAIFAHPLPEPSKPHTSIVENLRQCFSSDASPTCGVVLSTPTRVEVDRELHYYPDLVIVSGHVGGVASESVPIVLIEVASKVTAQIDYREKFLFYQRLPSLRQYVIVAEETRWVQYFDVRSDGDWSGWEVTGSGAVPFTGVNITLTLDDIYWGIDFPAT